MDQKRDANGRFVATKPNYQKLFEQEQERSAKLQRELNQVRKREEWLLSHAFGFVRIAYRFKLRHGEFE